jgi:hypothetical protein
MKHQWMAYVIVAVLSIGAGVAIAGLPNNVPVDATIILPSTTEAPRPTVATTTTVAPTTTTAPTTTDAPTTTQPPTTEAPTTTEPALPDRSELAVVAANGAGIAGTAARNVTRLVELGYTNAVPRDGSQIVEFTTVYFVDGFEEEALRLASDLDLLDTFVAPLAEAPVVQNLPDDVQLLAYIGIDRAN